MNHGYLPDLVSMEFLKYLLDPNVPKAGWLSTATANFVKAEKKRLDDERKERSEKLKRRRAEAEKNSQPPSKFGGNCFREFDYESEIDAASSGSMGSSPQDSSVGGASSADGQTDAETDSE